VDLIVKYAVGRSGIVGFQLHREKISVGISYDFPVLRRNTGNLGALELGLELRRLVSTRAQKLAAKRRKETLARKEQQPKTSTPPTDTAKVETPVEPPVVVETQEPQEEVTPTANAGRIKQDPMIIERVTLHFAFDFNSSDLDEPTETFLDQLAEQLKQDDNLQLTIEGHTDNIGSDKFNLRLSQKRADVVRSLLIKKGIEPERLHTEGKGMREPLNDNETDADRAKNRRVEITVFY